MTDHDADDGTTLRELQALENEREARMEAFRAEAFREAVIRESVAASERQATFRDRVIAETGEPPTEILTPPPSDEELDAAIARESEHAERLRTKQARIDKALAVGTQLLDVAINAALKALPHLIEQIDDDANESGKRIADGVLRFLRKK